MWKSNVHRETRDYSTKCCMSRSTRLIHLFWLNRWFTDTQILHGEAVSWCMQFNITISCSTFLFHSEVWLRWYNKTGVDFTSMEKVVPSVIVSTKHSLPCLAITVKGGATASWYFFFFSLSSLASDTFCTKQASTVLNWMHHEVLLLCKMREQMCY